MRRTIQLFLICLLCLRSSWAQSPEPTQTAGQGSATQTDPLGRTTPQSTLLRFLEAAQRENYPLASRYLQSRRGRASTGEDEELVKQLNTLLNRKFVGRLDSVSNDPAGSLKDGFLPDYEKAGEIQIGGQVVSLMIVRADDPHAGRIWLISADTLKQIPELAELDQISKWESRLPQPLIENQFLRMPLWQWIAVVVLYPIALAAAWLATLTLKLGGYPLFWLVELVRKKRVRRRPLLAGPGPITLLLMLYLHYQLVGALGIPLLYRQYYRQVVGIPLAIGLGWLLYRLTDLLASRIVARLTSSRLAAANSILPLGRLVIKVGLFTLVGLIILNSIGFNVGTALAGIGIGGLALGLGAQKTLENFFGGVSVLSDHAFSVGDLCKIGEYTGTVEDIGLRSTRIRTVGRTIASIPNGYVAAANLENYTRRDKILFKHIIGLRYETSADQLRYLLAEIRKLLYQHACVESPTARVRLVGFGTNSIDLEIFAYVLSTEYVEFLGIQEDLLLRIFALVESAGSGLAFPSQTLYVSRDKGLDKEKGETASAAVEEWRQKNQLPFPDHDATTIAQIDNTLEYPPETSALRKRKV
jgi:MscS family membrane protein